MARILVVEDERNVALTLKNELSIEGYAVEIAHDGEAAQERALNGNFDLILLDVGLPKKDGNAVCRELRNLGNRTPILMLTARGTEADKVLGLNLGADDYLAKPWPALELLARVRALLRRTAGNESEVYAFGDIEIDFTKAEVRRKDKPVAMTRLEYRLLTLFVRRRGRLQLRDKLYIEVGANSPEAIDNHIMNLRRKIEPTPEHPVLLVTVPGMGFRFDG